ncbi:hypothetical protein A0H81_09448 [Grifola frondosa]|uniref:Uncharacterized protein n=1 Tax=Grifola frondosa TaxID=5627 RepID=A0A1C7M686_GRIFR|nr:hypothetical protein A0H81_09448 [Grifola frondosa]
MTWRQQTPALSARYTSSAQHAIFARKKSSTPAMAPSSWKLSRSLWQPCAARSVLIRVRRCGWARYRVKDEGIFVCASSRHLQTRRFLDTLKGYLIDVQRILIQLHLSANQHPEPFVDHAGVLRDSKTGRPINGRGTEKTYDDEDMMPVMSSSSAAGKGSLRTRTQGKSSHSRNTKLTSCQLRCSLMTSSDNFYNKFQIK